MLTVLFNTTDTLDLVTDSAATLKVLVTYTDRVKSSGAWLSTNRTGTSISTATTTTILAAPAATEVRAINTVFIVNTHASLSVNVTPRYNANATIFEQPAFLIAPGGALEYIEYLGWFPLAATSKLDRRLSVTSNVVNATISFADVTGLTINLKSGLTYSFLSHLVHVNNATTTGSRFGINIGAVPTSLVVSTIDTVTPSVTASAHSAGVVTAIDTAATAQTTGSITNRLAILSGYIIPSANGTFAIRCASEVAVAAGLTVLAGSWLHIWEPN